MINKNRLFSTIALLVSSTLWGCGAPITVAPLLPEEVANFEAAGNYPHREYRIEPGDTLSIRYAFHMEMNQEVTVLPDGKVAVSMVGEVATAGLTTSQLEKLLVEKTSDRLRNPEVVVTISKFVERGIYIGGEVSRPGMVPYKKGLTPLQAVIAAGGFLDTAQMDSVIVVRTGGTDNTLWTRKLDLQENVRGGVKEPVFLAPHDIIYVPKSAIAEADLWVKQHIVDLLPFMKTNIPIGSFMR